MWNNRVSFFKWLSCLNFSAIWGIFSTWNWLHVFFFSKIPFIFDTFNTLKRGGGDSGEMSLNSVTSLQMYHEIQTVNYPKYPHFKDNITNTSYTLNALLLMPLFSEKVAIKVLWGSSWADELSWCLNLNPLEGIIAMPLIELSPLHCSPSSYSNEATWLDSIKLGGSLRRLSCYLEIKFFPQGLLFTLRRAVLLWDGLEISPNQFRRSSHVGSARNASSGV